MWVKCVCLGGMTIDCGWASLFVDWGFLTNFVNYGGYVSRYILNQVAQSVLPLGGTYNFIYGYERVVQDGYGFTRDTEGSSAIIGFGGSISLLGLSIVYRRARRTR